MATIDDMMDCLWTVKRFAAWKYGTDEPTKSNVNQVYRMCKEGNLPALKLGKQWRIDVRKILEGARYGK